MDQLITLSYALNVLLFLSFPAMLIPGFAEKRYPAALIRFILACPILASVYFMFAFTSDLSCLKPLLMTEILAAFSILRFMEALNAESVFRSSCPRCICSDLVFFLLLTAILGAILLAPTGIEESREIIRIKKFSAAYLQSVFLMFSYLAVVVLMERFWRSVDSLTRYRHRALIVAIGIIVGLFIWYGTVRLTFLALYQHHLILGGWLVLVAFFLAAYATARHRLLNRRIFISRQVVFHSVAPLFFGVYLLGVGLVSLAMRLFGWELSFVLKGLAVSAGGILAALLVLSDQKRRQVQNFIATHFYVNKYEYRDEWLAFSQAVQGLMSEEEIAEALRIVLEDSLYVDRLFIWLSEGDSLRFRRLVREKELGKNTMRQNEETLEINPDTKELLIEKGRIYLAESDDFHQQPVADLMKMKGIVLLYPLLVGGRLLGLLGIGPELTGKKYGRDDFDLLDAICSQAASAILAARMAGELAENRQMLAWNRLSAFVLHDIKNASAMLKLVLENASDHMDDPEFQKDMLEAVEDALKRMDKVRIRLKGINENTSPKMQKIELVAAIKELVSSIKRRLPGLEAGVSSQESAIMVHTDPAVLSSILENLFLNSLEAAGSQKVRVHVHISRDTRGSNRFVNIAVTDNGPGIPEKLLPSGLFEPFATTKRGGTGIGLWQVRRLVEGLGGQISAENTPEGGARFIIRLPA